MTKDEKKLLEKELQILKNASEMLLHSYTICKNFGFKELYPLPELDALEALTARYARLNDLIIRKMFRLIDRLDVEQEGTVRDSINRAEKKGLIDNADQFREAREIRNIIAHEYLLDDMSKLYQKVLCETPHLIDIVRSISEYCKRY